MATATEPKKHRFRLLRGTHVTSEPDPEGGECTDCEDGKVSMRGKKKLVDCPACRGTGIKHIPVIYTHNDLNKNIVLSSQDLVAICGHDKFQNLDEIARTPDNEALLAQVAKLQKQVEQLQSEKQSNDAEEEEDLQSLSIRALRKLAADRGVDVAEASNKDEIVNLLRQVEDTA